MERPTSYGVASLGFLALPETDRLVSSLTVALLLNLLNALKGLAQCFKFVFHIFEFRRE
ncbi:hypothetical protein YTPLAS72_05360 [Nitrospira sp.]|nr:hypothetical protein YTPLAS72_05360 [Nitrospira sp.]